MSFASFRRLHGKLQHVAQIMPIMRGFMTPLNAILAKAPPQVGLGSRSELRELLQHFQMLLHDLQDNPTPIYVLVPPPLPHVYGYTDASAAGAGGVWLPCTHFIAPIVWRLQWPAWITAEVRKPAGRVTNSDVEMAAAWLHWTLLSSRIPIQAISAYIGSDNSPTVGWHTRMASRATSPIPERFLRSLATMARNAQAGVVDVEHIPGTSNLFGDFPSRSFHRFPNDSAFLTEFQSRFPLPLQLGSWSFAPVPPELVLQAISMLQTNTSNPLPSPPPTGCGGLTLPPNMVIPPSLKPCRQTSTSWTVSGCSWPLLSPSGVVDSTLANRFQARPSRKRFDTARKSWNIGDMQTPERPVHPSPN